MCQNWNVQIGNLLVAEQSTVDGLMTAEGVSPETEQTTDAAFVAAESALLNFKSGDDLTVVQSVLTSVLTVTEALSSVIPPQAEIILTVVISGIKGAIAIFQSQNKATPAAQKAVMAKAVLETQAAIPGFKLSEFEMLRANVDNHVAAKHYRRELDKAVDAAGPEFAHLRQ